jgi:hypothetical protein
MKEEIRRAIAASAVAKATGTSPSSVYSYQRGKHTPMSSGYDYEAQAHFSDSYHYGTGSHISLQMNGTNFSGYDYGDSHHFAGSVNGRAVQIYDYGEGRYYNYSV